MATTRGPSGAGPVLCSLAALILSACSNVPGPSPPSAAADPAPPPPALSVTSEGWSFHNSPGRILTTPRYRLFTTMAPGSLLDRAPAFLEAAHERYTTALALLPSPREPLDTFLFAERWQWERFTHQFMGAQAGVYLRVHRGGYAAAGTGVYYDIGPHDTLAIAAHEGWHQFTQRTFAEPLPVWLEEGIACWMEGFRAEGGGSPRFLPWANVERFDRLRDAAAAGRLQPLRDVLDGSPGQLLADSMDAALDWYAQVWVLIHFLDHSPGYRAGLQSVLMDAARGATRRRITEVEGSGAARRALRVRTGAAHFRAYFTPNTDAAGEEYARFVSAVVRTGSKDRIVQGLPPH